jgi:hypothetical protein
VGPWGCPEEQNWPFRGLWKHLALQTRLTIGFSGGEVYFIGRAESPGWKFRLSSEGLGCIMLPGRKLKTEILD